MTLNLLINQYLLKIKNQLASFGANKKFIIGISGGVDSAVGLAILTNLLPKERILPFYITFWEEDDDNINQLSETFGIKIQRVNLNYSLDALKKNLNEFRAMYTNNWLPKLRSLFLYDQALKNNGIVISCLNYSEYYLGYFTKFGDGQGDFFPLSGLLKSQVYKLAHYLHVPESVIAAKPSPGFIGITDEEELGFKYADLEKFLDGGNVSADIEGKIRHWHEKNKHKMATIPILPREDF